MWVRPVESELVFERLRRTVETPVFRFVLIQALPQRDVWREVDAFLKQTFADRSVRDIDLLKSSYQDLLKAFDETSGGFVLLRNFEHLLLEPELYVGFNQRRDRFAEKPIAIIAVLPTGVEVIRLVQDRIPDFWSLRSAVLEIRYRYQPEIKNYYQPLFRQPEPDTRTFDQKIKALADLNTRLSRLRESNENPDAIVAALRSLVLLNKDMGRAADALSLCEEGLSVIKPDASTGDRYYALHFRMLRVQLLIEQGAFESAEKDLVLAEKHAAGLGDHPSLHETLYLRAFLFLEKDQPEAARDYLEQVFQRLEEEADKPEVNIKVRLQTLYGLACIQSGEWNLAQRLLEAYIKSAQEQYLSAHVEILLYTTKFAAELLNRYGDVVYMLKSAMLRLETTIPEESADYPFTELFWASGWFFTGLDTNYQSHFENALRVFTERYGPEHPLTADALYHRGQFLFFIEGPHGKFIPDHAYFDEIYDWENRSVSGKIIQSLNHALSDFRQAYAIYEKFYGPDHKKTVFTGVFIAFIHLLFKEFNTAKDGFITILKKIETGELNNADYAAAVCYFGLGQVYEQRGRWRKATGYYAAAYLKMHQGQPSRRSIFHFMRTEAGNIDNYFARAERKLPENILGSLWQRFRNWVTRR